MLSAMWRERCSKIARRSSCGIAHQAGDFRIGISAAIVASGRPSGGDTASRRGLLRTLDVARVPGDAGQPPGPPEARRDAFAHVQPVGGRQRLAGDRRAAVDLPRAGAAADEGRGKGAGRISGHDGRILPFAARPKRDRHVEEPLKPGGGGLQRRACRRVQPRGQRRLDGDRLLASTRRQPPTTRPPTATTWFMTIPGRAG